jgi:hypothetical protein
MTMIIYLIDRDSQRVYRQLQLAAVVSGKHKDICVAMPLQLFSAYKKVYSNPIIHPRNDDFSRPFYYYPRPGSDGRSSAGPRINRTIVDSFYVTKGGYEKVVKATISLAFTVLHLAMRRRPYI